MRELLSPLILTFELAAVTTLILAVTAIPFAYWLASANFRGKSIVESVTGLPIVLPPSVLGFYLLVFMGPHGSLGGILAKFDIRMVFTFEGLVFASVIYSLPFMVQPVQAGFEALPHSLKEASYTLGKSRIRTFFMVMLPNIKPSLITGIVLSFAHTVGEFGVVLMIGGSIPDETRVASIAIYDQVEAMNYSTAHFYSAVLFVLAFAVLVTVNMVNRKISGKTI
ncbi:molybdate ABC transporter permease subunit [Seleniivibrio woodruffii]|uniref:Molybdenum transport system permease n=1 Tax=Seleniivibrio woodruffii TaxID=1078050 RepID=A0A4R1KDK3_9BACT|nr:molybdate ABC transporter permease subunit [Seleniivibrio woodruffii]TCK62177.1 molybdate transport system permease protein [Seleniivibrio woodruffii]TVZ34706.1 molybdate transport system permease protein [Seleniivibrio woodruffii]